MQFSLFQSCVPLFPVGSWARPSDRAGCVVVFVASELPILGLAPALLSAGCVLRASHPLPGGVALLLSAPTWVASDLLSLPRPMSQGSRTEGVLLPW